MIKIQMTEIQNKKTQRSLALPLFWGIEC